MRKIGEKVIVKNEVLREGEAELFGPEMHKRRDKIWCVIVD